MKILIPTRGRPNMQYTAELLRNADIPFTLVLNSDDEEYYPEHYNTMKVSSTNIVSKRQAIIDLFGNEKLVMCDDDMKFFTRGNDRYRESTREELQLLFKRVEHELNTFAHVGTSSRFMANYRHHDHELGGRYIRLLAYNFKLLTKPRPQYRFPGHEDHDFNMQMQALGCIPKVLTCFAQDDHGQFNPGGCSTWRTPESDLKEMQTFAEAWPVIVSFSKPNGKYPIGRMRIAWAKLRSTIGERRIV